MVHPIFVHVVVFMKNPFTICLLVLTYQWLIVRRKPRQLVNISESGRHSKTNYRCPETWFPVMGQCFPPSCSYSWPIRCNCDYLDHCLPLTDPPSRLAPLACWSTKPNSVVHGESEAEQAEILLRPLHQQLHDYYRQFHEDPSFLLPRHHHLFTGRMLEQRLKHSYDHITCWLRTVKEAHLVVLAQDAQL
jgi:hypothetical protein